MIDVQCQISMMFFVLLFYSVIRCQFRCRLNIIIIYYYVSMLCCLSLSLDDTLL